MLTMQSENNSKQNKQQNVYLVFAVEFSLMVSLDGLDGDFESELRVLDQLVVVFQLFHLSLQFEEFLQMGNCDLFVHFHIQPVPAAS